MNAYWYDNIYLLYIGCLIGFTYFVFTLKAGLKALENWKDAITDEIQNIKQQQSQLREILPEKYVLNERYETHIRDIKIMLDKISDKLDCKIDRSDWQGVDRRKNMLSRLPGD